MLALLLTAGLTWAAIPAAAHAQLIGSDPADGATLDEPPTQVELEFNEPVRGEFTQVAVLDGSDNQYEVGEPEVTDTVVIQRVDDLPAGEYRISYRVGSADGHPVSGVLTFTVGAEAGQAGAASQGGPAGEADESEPGLTTPVIVALTAGIVTIAGVVLLGVRRRKGADTDRVGGRAGEGP